MKLLSLFKRKKSPATRYVRPAGRRAAAGKLDNLTFSFKGTNLSADAELLRYLKKIRARSRELCTDNDYGRKFLHMVKANVIGVHGIRLQPRAMRQDGSLDQQDNQRIDTAWREWGRIENCTTGRQMSWLDAQRLFAETVARDGEVLIRMVAGARNDFNFALQFIEADQLDVDYNHTLRNGNRIRMGVEQDQFGAPIAYHLLTTHPGGESYMHSSKRYDRVPADQMIHAFMTERPGQSRGMPWMVAAIRRLNRAGKYEEAELVAAQWGAEKLGAIKREHPDDPSIATEETDGERYHDSSSGLLELPYGADITSWDPQHPVAAFDSFMKAVLRGAASGLNVSYHGLANDLEGVNFSSIRSGVLEERDQWRVLQGWVVEHFHDVVYRRWLIHAISSGQLQLPMTRLSKFQNVIWQPRGWSWVDPKKDGESNALSWKMRTKSLTQIASEQGRDLEDVLKEIQSEQKLLEQYGLSVILDDQPEEEEKDDATTEKD